MNSRSMTERLIVVTVFFTTLFASPRLSAQDFPASQVELNGFLLGQYDSAPDGQFGKPTQVTKTEDGWIDRAYVFDKDHAGYMAFKYPSHDSRRMLAIQIAGRAGTQMAFFLGLRVGDDKSKVVTAVGSPSAVEHETDYPVDLWKYKGRNYSFEIDRGGKLFSIQIMGYDGFAEGPARAFPDIESFRKAVVGRDADTLMNLLAGDLEIYQGEQTYTFSKAARSELENSDSKVTRLLLGEKDSIRAAFVGEKFEPDTQLRVYTKASPGSVVKFEHSKILREVVYKFEAGAWRIWEITLR
jgi:hypothetical protein